MNNRFWVVLSMMVVHLSVKAAEPERKGDDVFGLTKVHQIHLEVKPADYKALEPSRSSQFGFGARPQRGLPAPGSPDAGVGKFNFDFKYVPATVHIGEQKLNKVGLRYKGNGTYIYARTSSKKSFKLDFDRFDKELRFDDLKKLNLHCGVTDKTKIREILAYSVFRAVGVPACRTAYAQVSLTVPDKFDKEHLGLYNVVEQVDKSFLKHHFGSSKGLLLKPEGVKGVPYLGDNPKDYEVAYNAKTEGAEEQWKRLVKFTHLVNRADEATFQKEIANYLDIDSFVKFLAATTMVATMDSILGFGHNFYLYLSPKTNKFTFMPWDLDHAFGAFFPVGTVQQQVKMSINHPHAGDNKLFDRILAVPKVKAAYHKEVKRIATTIFTEDKLLKDIETLEKLTKEMIVKDEAAARSRRESSSGFGRTPFGGRTMSLSAFVKQRAQSALAQLEGREKGVVLRASFGAPRPNFGGRRPNTGFNPFGRPSTTDQISKPLIDALDTNKDGKLTETEFTQGMKKLFEQWDKDKSSGLDEREMREGLQRLRPRTPRRP